MAWVDGKLGLTKKYVCIGGMMRGSERWWTRGNT